MDTLAYNFYKKIKWISWEESYWGNPDYRLPCHDCTDEEVRKRARDTFHFIQSDVSNSSQHIKDLHKLYKEASEYIVGNLTEAALSDEAFIRYFAKHIHEQRSR